jgi:chromosome segregation ATPase
MDAKINSNNEHINEYQNIINENNNINNDIINDASYSNKNNLNAFDLKISGDTENQMNNINSQILNSNIGSIYKTKVKAKNKLNSLNSMDNLFVNNEYSNISDIKEKNKKGVNNSLNDLNIFADDNKQRYKKLSNKLNNLNNSAKYSSVINDKRAIISKLEKSIKDFENNIKIYKNLKRTKDIECQKISNNNKKLLDNTEINREKSKEYFDIKYGFDNKDIINEYNRIKNENIQLKEQIFTIQNDINKMNLEFKLLNKKKEDDIKLCENLEQEINLYKKHSENLKKNLKVLDKHTDDIEEVLDKMSENYF